MGSPSTLRLPLSLLTQNPYDQQVQTYSEPANRFVLFKYWHIADFYPGLAPLLDPRRCRPQHYMLVILGPDGVGQCIFISNGAVAPPPGAPDNPWMKSTPHGNAVGSFRDGVVWEMCFNYLGHYAQQFRKPLWTLRVEKLPSIEALYIGKSSAHAWCFLDLQVVNQTFLDWVSKLPVVGDPSVARAVKLVIQDHVSRL